MSQSKKNALRARSKPATLGSDLDVSRYSRKPKEWSPCPLSYLPKEVIKRSLEVGVVPDENKRSATYFQMDHSVVFQAVQRTFKGKIEIMSTVEALKKYNWLKDYWWRLIEVDTDKYTAITELNWDQGYFIRVRKGQKVALPLQACMFISTDNLNQNVHNVIIAEPHSEVQVITGCAIHPSVSRGLHVGVSEFYVKENAKLTFTMIHNWTQDFDVRPRTAALVEDNGVFISNYVCLKPVKSLQMYPVAYLKGVNSRVQFSSILYGTENSYLDVGAKIVLQNRGSRGEVITRAIARDNAQIYARGFLIGEHDDSKAHLECRGLLLSDNALIQAIPELLAKSVGADLSHEAAVGKIAEEQVQYLMARGFSEEEAEALIVRGFMDINILGLPEELRNNMAKLVETTVERSL